MTNLYVDLDETLIKSVEMSAPDSYQPNAYPDFVIGAGSDAFKVYLRPDIKLLQNRAFNVFTAAAKTYGEAIVRELRRRGFDIREVYTRKDIEEGNLISAGAGVLIDDLFQGSVGLHHKLRLLPNATAIQIHAIRVFGHKVVLDKSEGVGMASALREASQILDESSDEPLTKRKLHKRVRKKGFRNVAQAQKSGKALKALAKFKRLSPSVQKSLLDPDSKRLLTDDDLQEELEHTPELHFDGVPLYQFSLIDIVNLLNSEASKPSLDLRSIERLIERILGGFEQSILGVVGRTMSERISRALRSALNKLVKRAKIQTESIGHRHRLARSAHGVSRALDAITHPTIRDGVGGLDESPAGGARPPAKFIKGGRVKLYHFTRRDQGPSFVIDPEKAKTQRGSYSRREFATSPTPRTFFYLDAAEREQGLKSRIGQHLYVATVRADEVYNLRTDPLGIIGESRNIGGVIDFTEVFRAVRGAGFSGVYYNPAGHFHTVAMLVPVDAQKQDVNRLMTRAAQ